MSSATNQAPHVHELTGIEIPVINERAVRAAAGLLFLAGAIALSITFFTQNPQPLRAFAIFFLADIGIRLGGNYRFAPSMALGGLITRSQRPELVALEPKKWAWALGFGLASISCLAIGWGNLDTLAMVVLCGVCLTVLYAESAFGICVGCTLHRLVKKEQPQLCPGDTCTYTPPSRRSLFRSSGLPPQA